jgi:hypothetical protein
VHHDNHNQDKNFLIKYNNNKAGVDKEIVRSTSRHHEEYSKNANKNNDKKIKVKENQSLKTYRPNINERITGIEEMHTNRE